MPIWGIRDDPNLPPQGGGEFLRQLLFVQFRKVAGRNNKNQLIVSVVHDSETRFESKRTQSTPQDLDLSRLHFSHRLSLVWRRQGVHLQYL